MLGSFLFLLMLLAIPIRGSNAQPRSQQAQNEDAGLQMLAQIKMPHTFSPGEMRTMRNQLDALRLGIELVLASMNNMTAQEEQVVFNKLWPGAKCFFANDFKMQKQSNGGQFGGQSSAPPQQSTPFSQPRQQQQQQQQQQPSDNTPIE
jgi:hypothetical protein